MQNIGALTWTEVCDFDNNAVASVGYSVARTIRFYSRSLSMFFVQMSALQTDRSSAASKSHKLGLPPVQDLRRTSSEKRRQNILVMCRSHRLLKRCYSWAIRSGRLLRRNECVFFSLNQPGPTI